MLLGDAALTCLVLQRIYRIAYQAVTSLRPEIRVAAFAALILLAFTTPSTATGVARHALARYASPADLAYSVSTSVPESWPRSARSAYALLTTPKYDDGLNAVQVKPVRILTQVRTHREYLHLVPDVRFSFALQPNQRKVLRAGVDGIRVVTERVTTWDSTVVARQLMTRAVIRNPRRGVIMAAVPRTLSQLPIELKYRRVATLISAVATAYTAGSASAWSTGYTATGILARYGVVAVDPRVIPLGSHLFIPGYGYAIAADTGGAIIGNRVDLCMDSLIDALNFGRQAVKVYILKE